MLAGMVRKIKGAFCESTDSPGVDLIGAITARECFIAVTGAGAGFNDGELRSGQQKLSGLLLGQPGIRTSAKTAASALPRARACRQKLTGRILVYHVESV